jgi:hypothetical protein
VAKPEEEKTLSHPKNKCVHKIRTDLGEIEWGGMDWVLLYHDRDGWMTIVNAVFNLRVPQNASKLLSGCTVGDLSRMAPIRGVSYCFNQTSLPRRWR